MKNKIVTIILSLLANPSFAQQAEDCSYQYIQDQELRNLLPGSKTTLFEEAMAGMGYRTVPGSSTWIRLKTAPLSYHKSARVMLSSLGTANTAVRQELVAEIWDTRRRKLIREARVQFMLPQTCSWESGSVLQCQVWPDYYPASARKALRNVAKAIGPCPSGLL